MTLNSFPSCAPKNPHQKCLLFLLAAPSSPTGKCLGNLHPLKNMIAGPQLATWPFSVPMLLETENSLGARVSQRNTWTKQKQLREAAIFTKRMHLPTQAGWASMGDMKCPGIFFQCRCWLSSPHCLRSDLTLFQYCLVLQYSKRTRWRKGGSGR